MPSDFDTPRLYPEPDAEPPDLGEIVNEIDWRRGQTGKTFEEVLAEDPELSHAFDIAE